MISSFKGKYRFLSNFSESPIYLYGIKWPTVEHIFQAAKTLDQRERCKILNVKTPGEAKKLGRKVKIRSDWENIKVDIMLKCLRLKFYQNKDLKQKLLETENKYLIEGNYWHDNFWGDCYCQKCQNIKGQNWLGLLLIQVRNEIKNGEEIDENN